MSGPGSSEIGAWRGPLRSRWWGVRWALCGLVVVHAAATACLIVPGYLSIDDATYHWMTKSLADGHGWEIENGYHEYPSPELGSMFIRPIGGRLIPQYPYLFPILALVPYRLAGVVGIQVVNTVAFLVTVVLCFAIARRLYDDSRTALVSVAFLVLATFAWEYSQALWPHMTATALVSAALYLMVRWADARGGSRVWWAAAAGGVVGLACGVRLDCAFAIPLVLLPPAFAERPRWREALAGLGGVVPGLALLALTNAARFGAPTPFSYGTNAGAVAGVRPYLAPLGLGLVVLLLAWVVSRRPVAARLAARPAALPLTALAFVGLVAALPSTRAALLRLAEGAYQLLVDLRARDMELAEPALGRTPGGGLVYIGALKKSLLQSCPYLPVVALPVAAAAKGGRERLAFCLLAIVPGAYVFTYSYFAWHGGLALNLRYFLPTLPCLAILAARGSLSLVAPLGRRAWALSGLAAITVTGAWLLLRRQLVGPAEAEFFILDLPLYVALLLALCLLGVLRHATLRKPWRGAAAFFVATGFVWAGLVAYLYDYPAAQRVRRYNWWLSTTLAPHVADDALLFAVPIDPFVGLIEHKNRMRIASPGLDDFRDFRRLGQYHLHAGRPVYLGASPGLLAALRAGRVLDGFRLQPVLEHPRLVVVRLSELAHAP